MPNRNISEEAQMAERAFTDAMAEMNRQHADDVQMAQPDMPYGTGMLMDDVVPVPEGSVHIDHTAPMNSWTEVSDGVYAGSSSNEPMYHTIDYAQLNRRGRNSMFYAEYPTGEEEMVERPDPTEGQLLPSKKSKVKEWSISARALKRVIMFAMNERQRYDYKFNAHYDNRFRIFRIWNASTENVVATVKVIGRDKVVIRYRVNSYYASVMESMNGLTTERGKKVIAIPSTNLAIHRGRHVDGVGQASKSKEAQLGYRRARYLESLQERDRNARKNNR